MLKLNLNLNKGKTQLAGGFKMPYSRGAPLHNHPKWVDEQNTSEVEKLIGWLFANYFKHIEGNKVMRFSLNKKDDHKNPDLFLHLEGESIGVQVTQFVLRDYLSRYNQAKGISEKLSKFIRDIYKPPVAVNVSITTPWDSDEVPRARMKKFKKLAKIIAQSISENINPLIEKRECLNFYLNKTDLKDIAEGYDLFAVPGSYQSSFFGSDNVYIDYGFDNVLIFKEDIKEKAQEIHAAKDGGNAEILVIWGDERQFMNTESHIVQALEESFQDTTFKMVYFIAFQNLLEARNNPVQVARIK